MAEARCTPFDCMKRSSFLIFSWNSISLGKAQQKWTRRKLEIPPFTVTWVLNQQKAIPSAWSKEERH